MIALVKYWFNRRFKIIIRNPFKLNFFRRKTDKRKINNFTYLKVNVAAQAAMD